LIVAFIDRVRDDAGVSDEVAFAGVDRPEEGVEVEDAVAMGNGGLKRDMEGPAIFAPSTLRLTPSLPWVLPEGDAGSPAPFSGVSSSSSESSVSSAYSAS
jgi:hypothetical protein